eukprot:10868970-Alexandrium_andersonii.AAC.1
MLVCASARAGAVGATRTALETCTCERARASCSIAAVPNPVTACEGRSAPSLQRRCYGEWAVELLEAFGLGYRQLSVRLDVLETKRARSTNR